MSAYPHEVRIVRKTDGEQDVDGVFVPGDDLVIYEGPADVQDAGRTLTRSEDGAPLVVSDAEVFLAVRSAAADVRTNDIVYIKWPDAATAKVLTGGRRMDGSVSVQWLKSSP